MREVNQKCAKGQRDLFISFSINHESLNNPYFTPSVLLLMMNKGLIT